MATRTSQNQCFNGYLSQKMPKNRQSNKFIPGVTEDTEALDLEPEPELEFDVDGWRTAYTDGVVYTMSSRSVNMKTDNIKQRTTAVWKGRRTKERVVHSSIILNSYGVQTRIEIAGKVRQRVILFAKLPKDPSASGDTIKLLCTTVVQRDREKAMVVHFVTENVDGRAVE